MSHKPYPKYSDSHQQWLGTVPDHWEIRPSKSVFGLRNEPEKIGDVHLTPSQSLGVLPQSEYMKVTGKKVVLALAGTAMKHVEVNDFVIHLRSFQGGIEWSRYRGKVSPAYTVLRPSAHAVPQFFKYCLKSRGYVETIASLTDQLRDGQSMRYYDFGKTPLPLPPVDEQHAIASFLDHETAEIDAFIADQEELIALLAERRTATVTRAVTKGLNPDVPVKDSGTEWLGSIPEHWQTRKIKTIVTIPITDGPHETPEILPEGVPFVSAEAVSSGNINFEKVRGFISEEDNLRFSKKYLPRKHDIFMVKSGATTGLCAIVDTDLRFNIWSPLAAIRCNQETSPRFLLHALRSLNFQESVRLFWNYGTQQNIGMKVLENLPIPYPDLEEQKSIATYLDQEISEINAAIADARETIALSKERRAAVISAAVTGKIDVRGLVAPATNNVEAESVGIA